MSENKGSVRRAVGWLTGDREVEAEGRLEEQGHHADGDEVEGAKQAVKDEHGDFGPAGGPVDNSDR